MPEARMQYQCPECGRQFKAATGLGSHMRQHGVQGSSKSVLGLRKQKAAQQTGTPGNEKENTIVRTEEEQTLPRTYNTTKRLQTAAADDRDHRLQAAATFAAGRIVELLQSVALEQDLPPKSLTALCIGVIRATTLR